MFQGFDSNSHACRSVAPISGGAGVKPFSLAHAVYPPLCLPRLTLSQSALHCAVFAQGKWFVLSLRTAAQMCLQSEMKPNGSSVTKCVWIISTTLLFNVHKTSGGKGHLLHLCSQPLIATPKRA